MDTYTKDEKKRIFTSELQLLAEEEYITRKQFEVISKAHQQYFYDMSLEESAKTERVITVKNQIEVNDRERKIQEPSSVFNPPKKKVEKKKLSAEDIRERNITWSLNLGVILLLIGGLFVATSNWETMSNWMKSGSIGLVTLLFFGISYLSKNILTIEKTGHAFLVLGSLFLPIFLLSIGWFKLLGEYLSFTGEGRYIFGFLSCLSIMPVYITIARRLSSRLFVWFSYLAVSAGVAYFIASFRLEKDWFYFGIMLFNVLVVIVFHRLKKFEKYNLFTKELVAFAQIQLILSSLLTLVFYQNHVVNGINILVTASVYLAMVYVSGRKEYHFVFSAMVVYGAFQIIEFSSGPVFQYFDRVFYVLVGIGFLVIPRFLDDQYKWKKIFQITSSVVSALAFFYITLDALFMNMNIDNPSWPLLLSYLLLAFQFIYLANHVQSRLFPYLSSIFWMAAFFEVVVILNEYLIFDNFLPIYSIGFVLFVSFGYFLKLPVLSVIRKSSRDIGVAAMCFAILMSLMTVEWFEVGLMLCLSSLIFYLCILVEERAVYKLAAPWFLPISLASGFMAFGEECRNAFPYYHQDLGIAMNALFGSIIAFISYFGWKKANKTLLSKNSFMIGQIFYSIGMILALLFQTNEIWMRPLVLLGGIGIYAAFYAVEKYKWIPYVMSTLTLVTFFTILQSIYLQVEVPYTIRSVEYSSVGALLLVISYLLKRKPIIANGFAWIGHLYLPGALMITFFQFGETSIWSFLLAALLYSATTYFVQTEWKIKTFLYSTFTSVFIAVLTSMMYVHSDLDLRFAFLITSIIVAGFWAIASIKFKKITAFYFVPFSILGIIFFFDFYPYDLKTFLVTVLYLVGLLVFLILNKWKIITIIPLLFIFLATQQFLLSDPMAVEWKLLITSLMGIIMLVLGKKVYQKFLQENENGAIIELDVYTITALLFFGSCYLYQSNLVWLSLVPGLLISMAVWLQRTKVAKSWSMWVKLFAGVYLLEPYYSTMSDLIIPELFEREIFVLPWVVVAIYLKRCLNGKYRKLTNQIQWAILVLVSLALVQDGLESSTIYDALILGTISLISMISGMFLRVKAYFFVGAGVLLLNVLLQTRPWWGNLPWWGYLLISGSILISIASYNEWHKQKTAKGETTGLTLIKQKLISWFNKWD